MNQLSVPNKYEYLTHPADLKICATGDTLELALDNLIQAITATRDDAVELQKSTPNKVKITITSHRLTSLVYDLCQRYLELIEVNSNLPLELIDAKITSVKNGYTLEASLVCAHIPGSHVQNLIKSPTYHEMNIGAVKNKTQVTVVFDI